MKKVVLAALAAISAFIGIVSTASAAPYTLVAWYQRSGEGTLSSLLFKAGTAQGCPNSGTNFVQPCYRTSGSPGMGQWLIDNNVIAQVSAAPPTFDWNGTTLTETGLFWATSAIGSSPNATPVISDRVTGLSIQPTEDPLTTVTNATTYQCIEGTFLAGVGASGCKNNHFNTSNVGANGYDGNGIDETTATWNVGNVNCVNETLGGDDYSLRYREPTGEPPSPLDTVNDGWPGTIGSAAPENTYHKGTPDPRGLALKDAGDAGAGCVATSGAFDLWHIYQNDATRLVIANDTVLTDSPDNCFLFPCPADPDLGGRSYLVLIPDADGDAVRDAIDNCPSVANTNQADTDVDGRGNMCDNCRAIANNTGVSAQCDSDGDTFGNRCDADFGNPPPGNGATNAQDYAIFRPHLGIATSPSGPYDIADLNCNGTVNAQDYAILRPLLGSPPGPGAGP